MESSWIIGLAITVGVIIIFKLLALPFKLIWKFLWNALLGWGALFLLNSFEPWTGFELPLNLATAAIVGILGLPGLIGLLLYTLFFQG